MKTITLIQYKHDVRYYTVTYKGVIQWDDRGLQEHIKLAKQHGYTHVKIDELWPRDKVYKKVI